MSNKRLSKYWDYDIKNLGKVMHIFIEKIAMNKKYSHFFSQVVPFTVCSLLYQQAIHYYYLLNFFIVGP